ncbi:hypothetical protein BD311DRAFT_487838, partial [Dichomitus squalens]
DFQHPSPSVLSAYSICREAERIVSAQGPFNNTTFKVKLINIRILGHLLSQFHFLCDTAISTVTKAISSCLKSVVVGTDEDHTEELNKLGEYCKNDLLRPFRKFKGRTPSGGTPPSRPSFEITKEQINEMLAEAPRNYSTLRKLVMKREDYRCIVTRIADLDFIQEFESSTGQLYEGTVESLECCHIFAESTPILKRPRLRTICSIRLRCGFESAETTSTPDLLGSSTTAWASWGQAMVTFRSADPDLPLLNPEYLRILMRRAAEWCTFPGHLISSMTWRGIWSPSPTPRWKRRNSSERCMPIWRTLLLPKLAPT